MTGEPLAPGSRASFASDTEMKADRWERVQEIFHLASALPEDERASFLHQKCEGDDELMQELEEIIHYSTGKIKTAISNGTEIYEFVEDKLKIVDAKINEVDEKISQLKQAKKRLMAVRKDIINGDC